MFKNVREKEEFKIFLSFFFSVSSCALTAQLHSSEQQVHGVMLIIS